MLALSRLFLPKTEAYVDNIYGSIDPTPPSKIKNVEELEKILNDENETLYNRYKAMFSLRNIGSTESIIILSKGKCR